MMKQSGLIRLLNRLANAFLKVILRTPLYRLANSTTLITVTGRRTGARYTTPVNYVRDGDELLVVSRADRTWWRNLRGGAPVTVWQEGRPVQAIATCSTFPADVARGLARMREHSPMFRKHLRLTPGADEQAELLRLAESRVIATIELLGIASSISTTSKGEHDGRANAHN